MNLSSQVFVFWSSRASEKIQSAGFPNLARAGCNVVAPHNVPNTPEDKYLPGNPITLLSPPQGHPPSLFACQVYSVLLSPSSVFCICLRFDDADVRAPVEFGSFARVAFVRQAARAPPA